MRLTDRPDLSRRTFLWGGVGLAGAATLSACGGGIDNTEAVRADGSVDLSKVTLVVGDQKGTSAQQMLGAAGLDKTPYAIDWKVFSSGPPILEALDAGSLSVGQVGNTPPIFAAASKAKLKVVQAVGYTGKGDTIVVPKGSSVSGIADLKGAKVAVAQGSSANYNLLAQLKKAGLSYDDVSVENLQPSDALAAFSAGHLDAWAIWEPFTSQAAETYGARILADGSGVVNGLGFHVASDQALADRATQRALGDYLARITRAQVWAAQHPQQWSTIWAQQTGFAPAITRSAAARRPLQVIPVGRNVIASEQKMADAFAANGLVPGKVDLTDYFDGQFTSVVSRAAGSTWDADWAEA